MRGIKTMNEFAKGGCLCGELRYTVKLLVKWVAHCHCSICRENSGSAFVTWFGIQAENFNLDTGKHYLKWYSHTQGAERGFCECCGSSIFFRSKKWPDELHLTLANMKQDIQQQPKLNAYFDSHVEWAKFDHLKNISADGTAIN